MPQRERFDTHDLRRGFAQLKTHSHGATARALRHARSPQRIRRAQDTFARRHSEGASTRTISAEGSPSSSQIRTAPQRERFDTHDLRRGFAELKTNSHGATARALRRARSPQRVRRAQAKFARRHSESASTRTISAEGLPSSRHIRTAPQRERFDTHDRFAELKTHSHGATARALRHARSPQRVRRAQAKFARRHSESASTRTISAEGSPSSRQILTAPQRERFDAHDLRRGFAELKPNSHGATARALRHARSPQRVCRAQDTFARRHSESASTRTISAEGSPSARHIRAAPQRERFDTYDLRRGFAELETHSPTARVAVLKRHLHGATARALRHARSPQRVRRAQDTFARRHSESASTHNLRRGFPELALRHARSPQRVHFRLATLANERNPAPATKFTDPVSENAAPATHDLHQRKTCCAQDEKCAAVSQNAALAMEFCGNTQIRRSARHHSESAVLKKGPFRAKLSYARQLFATTAMALELRLSKRGSLTRQEDITAWRPCHQKTHFGLKKTCLARGFLKKRTPRRSASLRVTRPCQQKMHFASKNAFGTRLLARTSQLLPLPAKAEKCERHHSETHAPARTSISCETVASKTTFYAQGQQFEPTPRSTPGLNSYRKNPLV